MTKFYAKWADWYTDYAKMYSSKVYEQRQSISRQHQQENIISWDAGNIILSGIALQTAMQKMGKSLCKTYKSKAINFKKIY